MMAGGGIILWCCLLLHLATSEDTKNTKHDNRCGAECVRCAADGCVRCTKLLVFTSGKCAQVCPPGSHEAWAKGDRLMGRVCYPDDHYNEAMVGGCAGAALCLLLAACGAAYARCRPLATRGRPVPQAPPPDQDSIRLRNFHKQLDCLRPHAPTLLSILNNTRRQVRELYLMGNKDAAMAYSCVLSDLAKLLLLLNKTHVPVVPDEWPRLASWAERILKRYSRVTAHAPQPVTQLVDFLQTPITDDSPRFTTFKPPSYASSSMSYTEDIIDREFEHWNDGRPPSYSLFEKESIPLADPWGTRPLVRRESVWIEDEDLKMARPHGELTTEL